MRKILGSRDQYYDQTNNAQVDLFNDYFHKTRIIACGPTMCAMGFDVSGWPMSVFTPGVQPEDSILMMLHNRFNLELLKKTRNIDYDKYPPNEVPQVYDVVGEILYGKYKANKFEWHLNFDIIKKNIDNDICMGIHGDFPCGGHYVLIVGYDDEKNVIIFNDPYPPQWKDYNGYNREMTMNFFYDNISLFRIDFYPNQNRGNI